MSFPLIKTDKQTLRKFGMTMAAAFLILATLLIFRHKQLNISLLLIAGIFLIMGLAFPAGLKPVYIAWMKLAHVLGWINTRLILILIFYLVFTPIGLAMRLFAKDALDRKIDRNAGSYWKKKESAKTSYERQF